MHISSFTIPSELVICYMLLWYAGGKCVSMFLWMYVCIAVFVFVWRDSGVSLGAEFPVSLSNHVGFTDRLLYGSTHHWCPRRFDLSNSQLILRRLTSQRLMSRWKYQFSYDHWSQASWAQPVLRWKNFLLSAAVEQSRRKANMVVQGDGKFGSRGWPQNPPNKKTKKDDWLQSSYENWYFHLDINRWLLRKYNTLIFWIVSDIVKKNLDKNFISPDLRVALDILNVWILSL